MQINHYVISTTLAVGLLAASALPAAAAQLPDDAASSPIVSAIENQLDANASLPAAYAVVDGSEVTAGGREGADLDTPFVIGSVSKTFTALAVLAAVERGEISLNAPVTEYLPDFELAAEVGDEPIRIRHLLNHTSGIAGIGCNLDGATPVETLPERVEQLRDVTPVSEPGEKFAYCNVGFALLALALEENSATPFATVLQSSVLTPLGMTRTYTDLPTARENGLAEGRSTVMGMPVVRPENPPAATLADGYLVSTVRDLSRYAQFQMGDGTTADGVKLLSPELLDEMHRASVDIEAFAGTELESYALGWFTGDVNGTTVVIHGGTTPRYHATVAMVPSEQRAVVVLVAGQWLSGAGSTSVGAISTLVGIEAAVERLYPISTAVLWFVALLLVLTVAISVWPSRRRRRALRRPRLLSGPLLVLAGIAIVSALIIPAIPETGSLAAALQFGWENTPDLLVLALAWPLLLVILGVRSIVDRARFTPAS